MDNVTEWNVLIYAGAKLVIDKIGVLPRNQIKKTKQGWGIRLEKQVNEITATSEGTKEGGKKNREEIGMKRQKNLQKKKLEETK